MRLLEADAGAPGTPARGRPVTRPLLIDPRDTWVPFVGVCIYLASQSFQIPLIAIGPSWAVWPVLSDVAVGVMLVGWLLAGGRLPVLSPANREVLRVLLVVFGASGVAFVLASTIGAMSTVSESGRSMNFGIFQTFRLAEFLFVFRVAAGLPLTRKRARILSFVADATLAATFLGIVGTYTGLLSTQLLVSHLPSARSVAGPWVTMSMGQWYEAGTIGYNHSYVSVQMVMLAGISIGLRTRRNAALEIFSLALAVLGVFLSGSRAGMAAALVLVIAYLFKRPAALVIAVLCFGLLFSVFSGYLGDLGIGVAETTERQLTLQRPLDPENLSGRSDIWRDSWQFLLDEPTRWVVGAGPGSVAQMENNAHNLFLQVVMEGGVIGLILFGWAMVRIMASLHRYERGAKAVLWTSCALLLSSFTQETLYPVPSMSHFLGFYLFSVALVLAVNSNQPAAEYSRGSRRQEVQ